MKCSKFPLDCKIAKLKSLYKKKGLKTDPKSYHPVSLLPVVSKVTEKVVHNQTEIFLRIKVHININQGFKNHFQRTLD